MACDSLAWLWVKSAIVFLRDCLVYEIWGNSAYSVNFNCLFWVFSEQRVFLESKQTPICYFHRLLDWSLLEAWYVISGRSLVETWIDRLLSVRFELVAEPDFILHMALVFDFQHFSLCYIAKLEFLRVVRWHFHILRRTLFHLAVL